jgi:hypothetical protein
MEIFTVIFWVIIALTLIASAAYYGTMQALNTYFEGSSVEDE